MKLTIASRFALMGVGLACLVGCDQSEHIAAAERALLKADGTNAYRAASRAIWFSWPGSKQEARAYAARYRAVFLFNTKPEESFYRQQERDLRRAMLVVQPLTQQDHPPAWAMLMQALNLAEKRGAESVPEQQVWLERAAKEGNAEAMFALAVSYTAGGLRGISTSKRMWMRKAAEAGFVPAQMNLSRDLKNADDAARWAREAARSRHPVALYNLASLYYLGRGVPKDPQRAFTLTLDAAIKGWALAQIYAADAYFKGSVVPMDPARGAKWLRRAAHQGSAEARYRLARIYRTGFGVPMNKEKYLALAKEAAYQGYKRAQLRVVEELQRNRSNLPLAYAWASIASEYKAKGAKEWMRTISARMTDTQRRVDAVKLVRELRAEMTPEKVAPRCGVAICSMDMRTCC